MRFLSVAFVAFSACESNGANPQDLAASVDVAPACPADLAAAVGTRCPVEGVDCGSSCELSCDPSCFELTCYSITWTRKHPLQCDGGSAVASPSLLGLARALVDAGFGVGRKLGLTDARVNNRAAQPFGGP